LRNNKKNQQYVDLACQRFDEEKRGKSIFQNNKNGYREIVKNFVAKGNRVNDYDIKSVEKSRFAIPLPLLSQIEGETVMSWTGFVFEMKDGKMFSFGSSFLFAFFDLPDGYEFNHVAKIHNHSYIDDYGELVPIRNIENFNKQYKPSKIYKERPYFECYID
jgi:hypothetical protein